MSGNSCGILGSLSFLEVTSPSNGMFVFEAPEIPVALEFVPAFERLEHLDSDLNPNGSLGTIRTILSTRNLDYLD